MEWNWDRNGMDGSKGMEWNEGQNGMERKELTEVGATAVVFDAACRLASWDRHQLSKAGQSAVF